MRVCRSALALCLMAGLGTAQAADDKIARWTDEDGITHFSDVQFAPASAARVDVTPTNGMTAPTDVPTSTSTGPVWTVIDQAPRQNKVGWRSKSQGPRSGHISPSRR
jgi:hypothetical protein